MGDPRAEDMTVVSALESLGLDWRATMADARKAYRLLSLKYHPDRVLDDGYKADAQRRFLKVRNAYEFLRRHPRALRGAPKKAPEPADESPGAGLSAGTEFEALLRRYRESHAVRPSPIADFLSRVIEGGGWLGEAAATVALWMVYVGLVAALLLWHPG